MKRATKPAKPAPLANGDHSRLTVLLQALRADPMLAALLDEMERASKAQPGRRFGSNGLKVKGKLFALFTRGNLVVKLPAGRVTALVASGTGQRFDPGHGRLMKEWLTVTSLQAPWTDLVKEAHAFVEKAKR